MWSQFTEFGHKEKVRKWRITRKVSIIISFLLLQSWARVVFNMQCGSFKIFLTVFKCCWNASCARKYILSTITDLYFFWLIKTVGCIFGRQIYITVSKILRLRPWTLYSHKPFTLSWQKTLSYRNQSTDLLLLTGFYTMGPLSWRS